ncbi:hypothetical protein GCM10009554_38000 [Kribbella koreensis]|uniref:DUF3325 domain-containing protein n=1 Tax=Kribbella koreensis TaxID=57909 RepID=A0ABN1QM42_9ACTN
MTPVHSALVLLLAAVVSAQVLMLMEGERSLRQRLRDLSWGGDASSLLLATALIAGALGLLLGSLWHSAGVGAGAGLVLSVMGWAAAVAWAHRRPAEGDTEV